HVARRAEELHVGGALEQVDGRACRDCDLEVTRTEDRRAMRDEMQDASPDISLLFRGAEQCARRACDRHVATAFGCELDAAAGAVEHDARHASELEPRLLLS